MPWMKSYRAIVLINLVIIFGQFGVAGQMLAGRDDAVAIHGFTGIALVFIALVQTAFSIVLKAKHVAPNWVIAANVGIILVEVAEAATGHFHNVALHVPLALAIFAGVMRQLFWAVREKPAAAELRA